MVLVLCLSARCVKACAVIDVQGAGGCGHQIPAPDIRKMLVGVAEHKADVELVVEQVDCDAYIKVSASR